jgi:predicted Zn-dependent protease
MNPLTKVKSLLAGATLPTALAMLATVSACSTSQLEQTTNLVSSAVGIDDPERGEQIKAIGGGVTSVASSASPLSFETERALGGGIAIRAFDQIGPEYPNADVQRYVNLVGRVVAAQSSRPDLPYAFAVIDSPVPNAFAGPGGYIFLTTGSLRYMSNEAELAGVLAHEVAHVTELHMVKTWRRTNLLQGLSEVAAAADEDAAEYSAAVDQATETLFDKGLDKSFEYEADTVGVDLAALAGYDPAGLPTFLNKLASATEKRGGWYSTHPPLNERIGRLNRQVADLKVNGGVRGVLQADRFHQNVGHLFAGQ